ncbi:MAG: hypothetical protein NTW93_06610 [Phycisphaerae bacterium]|nr:hypothetical protein [Phycisphaerae bacterium]
MEIEVLEGSNMGSDINELKEAWNRATDSDVIKAATKDWGEYSPDAQIIIETEARNRGLLEEVLALRGEKTSEPISKEGIVSNAKEKEKPILDIVVRIGCFIIGFVLWKFLGLAPFILLLAFIIGEPLAKWYFERQKVNQTFIKWIVWSNVLTWFLLPPLGILTGSMALQFSNLVEQEKKKYKILAITGIGLSLINAIAGFIMRL